MPQRDVDVASPTRSDFKALHDAFDALMEWWGSAHPDGDQPLLHWAAVLRMSFFKGKSWHEYCMVLGDQTHPDFPSALSVYMHGVDRKLGRLKVYLHHFTTWADSGSGGGGIQPTATVHERVRDPRVRTIAACDGQGEMMDEAVSLVMLWIWGQITTKQIIDILNTRTYRTNYVAKEFFLSDAAAQFEFGITEDMFTY